MIIITDILKEPFDEGFKIATYKLLEQIKTETGNFIVSINAEPELPFVDTFFKLNKLLFSPAFYKAIKGQGQNNILYIPVASISLFSLIRAKLLNLFTKKNIFILSLQSRLYGPLDKIIIKAIKPKCIITQSSKTEQYLSTFGIKCVVLPLGVDDTKYSEFNFSGKQALRTRYKIEAEQTVVLHVGHIQQSRNLEWLLQMKEKLPAIEVIIVGSTYSKDDKSLYKRLTDKGIRIFNEYMPNMEDIYNLADFYVFPVLQEDGAIETPLSVLEAMACNLPVITTRFGSLPDTFPADDFFHYVQSSDEIIDSIKKLKKGNCNNRKKVGLYTWKQVSRQLSEIIN